MVLDLGQTQQVWGHLCLSSRAFLDRAINTLSSTSSWFAWVCGMELIRGITYLKQLIASVNSVIRILLRDYLENINLQCIPDDNYVLISFLSSMEKIKHTFWNSCLNLSSKAYPPCLEVSWDEHNHFLRRLSMKGNMKFIVTVTRNLILKAGTTSKSMHCV